MAMESDKQAKDAGFSIKFDPGKTGFLMFDGFMDRVMKSTTVEETTDSAVKESETSDKTIIENSGAAAGGPNPEDPNEPEKEEKNLKVEKTENLEVSQSAIHDITDEARKKQDEFIAKYEEIRKKVEDSYGKGNGDYEVYDDLYEIVPNRLP